MWQCLHGLDFYIRSHLQVPVFRTQLHPPQGRQETRVWERGCAWRHWVTMRRSQGQHGLWARTNPANTQNHLPLDSRGHHTTLSWFKPLLVTADGLQGSNFSLKKKKKKPVYKSRIYVLIWGGSTEGFPRGGWGPTGLVPPSLVSRDMPQSCSVFLNG